MSSSTKNVKMGVCRVYLDGIDLGLTKGGVEVDVSTDTHQTTVDQYGETIINEYIMKRQITAKVPLAETTVQNMARIMPGATLHTTGGTHASGIISFGETQPLNGQKIRINGALITFVSSNPDPDQSQVLIGADIDETITNMTALLNASTEPRLALCNYSYYSGSNTLTATYNLKGTEGNGFGLATKDASTSDWYTSWTNNSNGAVAHLQGGTDPDALRIEVSTGIGIDLLSVAKELLLRPLAFDQANPVNKSEDLIIYRCGTPGSMNFAYKYNDERVYNVAFNGYPDLTGKLFGFGDPAAGA